MLDHAPTWDELPEWYRAEQVLRYPSSPTLWGELSEEDRLDAWMTRCGAYVAQDLLLGVRRWEPMTWVMLPGGLRYALWRAGVTARRWNEWGAGDRRHMIWLTAQGTLGTAWETENDRLERRVLGA
jgi:hypothetical protein